MSGHGKKQSRKLGGGRYHWELQDWANKLFLEYDKCLVCGTKSNLEPHHILQVKPYDELYASISNGAVLCTDCHHEYHELYGGNINPVTLVMFAKKKYLKHNTPKNLEKKYKQMKKMKKYYEDKCERLQHKLDTLEDN